MPKFLISRFVLAASILAGACSLVDAKVNRVAVRANASKEYSQARATLKEEGQTYHIIKGKYFSGNVADSSLDQVTFEEVADHIALNLKRQNFYSEEDPEKGDLLVMVHYGASAFLGDRDRYGFTFEDILPPVVTASGEIYEYKLSKNGMPRFFGTVLPSQRRGVKELYFRSMILGMEGVFRSNVTSYEAFIQKSLSNEGRYFIYVSAFDLPLLRQGEKKILWTTRYSIRSIGQSFADAIKELNIVAGHYFGKDFDNLISKRSTDPSLVEVGEIEVIRNEEETNN
jgi:hypothetical protein